LSKSASLHALRSPEAEGHTYVPRKRSVDEHPRTPADLFASIKPALDAMSLDDLSEFSSHILHFIADRPAPIVAEVPLFDGDMPICNGSASAAHAEEYASVIDGVMFKILNTRRAFSPFLDRSKIVLEARVRWNGWTAVAQVERKKTKAEIADFDAREKALAEYMDKLPPPVILDEAGRAAHPDLAAEYDSMMAADKAKAADRERLKLLRERAEKNGYRLVKRGDYRLIREDGTGSGGYPNLDSVEWRLDAVEGKIADQTCTPCGTPIPGWNNSEAGLAAHPGKTMEDFERALPPVESTCAAEAEPSPEVVATAGVEAKADVFRRDFRTRELAPRAAVVAGLMADEFDVEIDCLGCWRVYKPGQASCAAA
jgi:hypothetical protein